MTDAPNTLREHSRKSTFYGLNFSQLIVALCALLLLTEGNSTVAETLNYNLYQLSTNAQTDVENDTMRVMISANHQKTKASDAAKLVNEDMAWATSLAKKEKNLTLRTNSYQTNPVYENEKIVAWQVVQQLELKGTDFDALSTLVGQMQDKLHISAMSFEVSENARQVVEDQLTKEALLRFRERSSLVQKTMGATKYQIVSLSVNAQGDQPPVYRGRMELMAKSAAYDAPEVEAGVSTLSVFVSGQIQLDQ